MSEKVTPYDFELQALGFLHKMNQFQHAVELAELPEASFNVQMRTLARSPKFAKFTAEGRARLKMAFRVFRDYQERQKDVEGTLPDHLDFPTV